jgi:hypothetical protein
MSRDDSVLYSGMSSQSFAKVQQKKAEVKETKNEAKSALEKNAHVVLTRLDSEIASIPKQIFDLVALNDTEEHYKASLIALKKYDSYLVSLRGEFINILGLKGKSDE